MYCGYIVELKDLRKHSNADRLQCAEVFGNNVIVDLSYHDGQKCVFFPTDGQLGKEYAEKNNLVRKKDEQGNEIGGYLDPEKRNIKAIRLRGEKSEGIALPVETLKDWCNIDELQVGDKITVLNGVEICTKYIPGKSKVHSSNGAKGKTVQRIPSIIYPLFKQHVDTEQLMFNQVAFKYGDKCNITLKMHGTSARTSYSLAERKGKLNWWQKLTKKKPPVIKEWEFVSGSRRTILKDVVGGYYGDDSFRKKWHNVFVNKLEKGETVYYEIVGWVNDNTPIMPSCDNGKIKDKEIKKLYGDTTVFSYGCERGQNNAYVYRMTLTNEDGYEVEYPDWLMRRRCEQMGVNCVPKFEEFRFISWDDLIARVEAYCDGVDPIGKTHVREGVVVRIENRNTFTAYKHKNITFKILEGIIKENADVPDMEEAQEVGGADEVSVSSM